MFCETNYDFRETRKQVKGAKIVVHMIWLFHSTCNVIISSDTSWEQDKYVGMIHGGFKNLSLSSIVNILACLLHNLPNRKIERLIKKML